MRWDLRAIKHTLTPWEGWEWRQAWCRGHKRPFRVTWGTTFYTEGAWDRPVLTGRQELVTLWKLQGIGLVKMRSDRILICLSLLCRHTDVKGKRRGCVVEGAGVIRPSRLIEKLGKKGEKGRFVHWLPRMNFCSAFFVCFKVIKATFETWEVGPDYLMRCMDGS